MRDKVPKIKELLKKAEDELFKYESSKRFVNLSQACEKTWVAFNLLVEQKSGKEIHRSEGVMNVAYELDLGLLYEKALVLHILHYEGSVGVSEEEFVRKVRETIYDIKFRLKHLQKRK